MQEKRENNDGVSPDALQNALDRTLERQENSGITAFASDIIKVPEAAAVLDLLLASERGEQELHAELEKIQEKVRTIIAEFAKRGTSALLRKSLSTDLQAARDKLDIVKSALLYMERAYTEKISVESVVRYMHDHLDDILLSEAKVKSN